MASAGDSGTNPPAQVPAPAPRECWLDQTEFDAIVVGTGLLQSILAGYRLGAHRTCHFAVSRAAVRWLVQSAKCFISIGLPSSSVPAFVVAADFFFFSKGTNFTVRMRLHWASKTSVNCLQLLHNQEVRPDPCEL